MFVISANCREECLKDGISPGEPIVIELKPRIDNTAGKDSGTWASVSQSQAFAPPIRTICAHNLGALLGSCYCIQSFF